MDEVRRGYRPGRTRTTVDVHYSLGRLHWCHRLPVLAGVQVVEGLQTGTPMMTDQAQRAIDQAKLAMRRHPRKYNLRRLLAAYMLHAGEGMVTVKKYVRLRPEDELWLRKQ